MTCAECQMLRKKHAGKGLPSRAVFAALVRHLACCKPCLLSLGEITPEILARDRALLLSNGKHRQYVEDLKNDPETKPILELANKEADPEIRKMFMLEE